MRYKIELLPTAVGSSTPINISPESFPNTIVDGIRFYPTKVNLVGTEYNGVTEDNQFVILKTIDDGNGGVVFIYYNMSEVSITIVSTESPTVLGVLRDVQNVLSTYMGAPDALLVGLLLLSSSSGVLTVYEIQQLKDLLKKLVSRTPTPRSPL